MEFFISLSLSLQSSSQSPSASRIIRGLLLVLSRFFGFSFQIKKKSDVLRPTSCGAVFYFLRSPERTFLANGRSDHACLVFSVDRLSHRIIPDSIYQIQLKNTDLSPPEQSTWLFILHYHHLRCTHETNSNRWFYHSVFFLHSICEFYPPQGLINVCQHFIIYFIFIEPLSNRSHYIDTSISWLLINSCINSMI